MRRTRFMTWFFLLFSLAFFLVPDFRYALEVPAFNHAVLTQLYASDEASLPPRFTLARFVSPQALVRLAESAGDPRLAAFASLHLVEQREADALRLADAAVKADPGLGWIYLHLGYRHWQRHEKDADITAARRTGGQLAEKLMTFDPENGAVHLLHEYWIRAERGKAWPGFGRASHPALAREMEWREEMEALFASPHIDAYALPLFLLERDVARERGWRHPGVWSLDANIYRQPRLAYVHEYVNMMTQHVGPQMETSGRKSEAQLMYGHFVRFGEKMQVQKGQDITFRLMGAAFAARAYERMAVALRKDGSLVEASLVEKATFQMRHGGRQTTGGDWGSTSQHALAAIFASMLSLLFFSFLTLSLLAVGYVNLKRFVRPTVQGPLFQLMTGLENYAPPLLLMSAVALYMVFAPYGQNFQFFLDSREKLETVPDYMWIANSYPIFPKADPLFGAPLMFGHILPRLPFADYLPGALLAFALLLLGALVSLLARRRHA
jgi:hypothetical protein